MKPIKGIFQDVQPVNQPEGTIFYAKNSIKYEKLASWLNEPGFKIGPPIGSYIPIGVISLDNEAIIFSTDNIHSVIGIFNEVTGIYKEIINRTDLEFNLANKITGRARRNYKGEIITVFTDRVKSAKYMNLSTANNLQDFKDFLLFPINKPPIIESSTAIDTGGVLLSGIYFISIQYRTTDNAITNFSEVSQPIYITKSILSDGVDDYCGIEASTPTSKSIEYKITNIDTSYDIMSIALISKINGIITSKLLPDSSISGSTTKTVTITGSETTSEIDIAEILVGNANYTTVGCFAQLNNQLFAGNLGSSDFIRFQKIANNIKINYTTKLTSPNSLTDVVVGNYIKNYASQRLNSTPRGFLHGEVYAFYISLILKNGSRTPAFHIPGREESAGDKDNSGLAATQGFVIGTLKYQVEDTSEFTSQDDITEFIGRGKMGFWENKNEKYPNSTIDMYGDFDSTTDYQGNPLIGGLNLQDQNVRHHRFPTISACKETHYAGNGNYGIDTLDILGIDVTNIVIPDNLKDKVDGYEIYYAKRGNNNSTVLGQSLMQFGAYYQFAGTPDFNKVWTTGGNWDLFADDASQDTDKNQMLLDRKDIRLYPFDLLQNKSLINSAYITNQLKLYHSHVADSQLVDPDKNWMAWNIGYSYAPYVHNPVVPIDSEKLRNASNVQYVPANVVKPGDGIYNVNTEEYINFRLSNPLQDISRDTLHTNIGDGYQASMDRLGFEQTYLTNINQLLSDIYNSFISQTLVGTGVIQIDVNKTEIKNVYGGDTFVSAMSYITVGPRSVDDVDAGFYVKISREYICESSSNIGLRHQTTERDTFYYPKTVTEDLLPDANYANINNWAYNKDYTSVNDLIATTPNDITSDKTNKFPYRIIRSNPDNREQRNSVNWRTFLANNYYESVQNKGEIINLEALGNDQLLIHHRNTLFVTRPTNKLKLDLTEVILGSGDIFGVRPEEPMPSLHGYLGTQHQLACLSTKHGYFSIDASVGTVYIYNGEVIDLTPGLRIFLRDNLNITPVNGEIDNPFTGNGISVAYDEKFERIIIGVKNSVKSYTISCDIESRSWASFHDYIPDYMFNTRNKVYSFKRFALNTSIMFIHNEGNKGVYYQGYLSNPIIPSSSYIDIVFKSPTEKISTLVLQSVDWVTEVFSAANISLFNSTFDFVTIRNNYQCSGKIPLTKGLTIVAGDHNNRNNLGTWNFNEFRDLVKDRSLPFINNIFNSYSVIGSNIDPDKAWFEKRKFDDKYFIVRLETSNVDNNTIYLHEANASARPSYR